MSSEHVEVLHVLRDRWAGPDEKVALDAAIASLSAPHPPTEANTQGDGLPRMEQLRRFVAWEREHNPDKTHIAEWALYELRRLYVAPPPSAPVGVEAVLRDALQGLIDFIEIDNLPMDADAMFIAKRALAQQPLTHGEAVAEVVEAEGYYGVGGWVKQPDDARDVRGLRGIRGLPIGTKLYLAQQPAYDGGFSAADMMDARQEGRKEAQQPAACDMGALCIGCEPRNADGSCPGQQPAADSPSFTAGDMADAAAQGFRDGVASVGVVGVEAREE